MRASGGYYARAGWSSQVARRAHNPEVEGSNPSPATTEITLFPDLPLGHSANSQIDSHPKRGENLAVRKQCRGIRIARIVRAADSRKLASLRTIQRAGATISEPT